MAHTLTEADTYTSQVVVPDDGDTLSAASVEAGFQDLTDRANFLSRRTFVRGERIYLPLTAWDNDDKWTYNAAANLGLIQGSITVSTAFDMPIPHMPGLQFDGITAEVTGAPSGYTPRGGDPDTKPALTLYRVTATSHTSLFSVSDPELVAGSYEGAHTFGGTFATETVDDTYSYVLSVSGESGTNAQVSSFAYFRIYLHGVDQT